MYTIIDKNNEHHGPVDEATIRQWIAEGRVDAQTLIQKNESSSLYGRGDDGEDFQTAASFPEFVDAVSGGGPPPIGSTVSPHQLPTQGTNGMAITGMVIGILSIVSIYPCLGLPFNILGTIFSYVALGQIKKNPQQDGHGMAVAGMVCSLISIGLAVILLIIGFIMVGSSGNFRGL